ncbi:MAG TPA: chromosomal replication initiator protein DnaA [Patescibacteria group bacterium]|nr:chromosomal replication initiator protein DnaA [Patescibacteria group bacterium]
MQDLWDRALGEVEVEVSKAVFLTLFKQTSLLSVEEDIATVSAPSMMVIDLLQRRFYQIIKKALDKQTGIDTRIVFIPKTPITKTRMENAGPLFNQQEAGKIVIGHLPRVRPDFTFENMAVSSSNQLAFVSCSSVAKKIGSFYNPLFIHGPVGVGKTHLMQAIANDVYSKNPNKKILYITSEEFTNEVVEAIRNNATSMMKKKFRNLDILLIDDVQFLAGKEKVQEELFHTFNILVDNSAQVVLSSDRHVSELKGVEKRLVSRFSGGLTVDIESPDFELRTAILLIKARKLGIVLPIDGAKTIAQDIKDTRALEGALLRIITQAEALGEDLTVELIKKAVENKSERPRPFGPDEIIKNVCSFYNIRPSQIKSAKRDAFLVRPRQVAMYLLKKDLGLTYSQIGDFFGGRDHTTVMHGVSKIEGLVSKNKMANDLLGISRLSKTSPVDY